MERTPIESSSLVSVGYDQESQTLEIEFQGGAVYQYFDVPQNVHEQLVGAPSAGGFLNEQIRGYYRYART